MPEDPFTPRVARPAAFAAHVLRRDPLLLRRTEAIAALLLAAEPDCPWVVLEARARRLAATAPHHSAREPLGADGTPWQTKRPAAGCLALVAACRPS